MMKQPHLDFFSPPEFINAHGDWWPLMSARLLVLLDVLRFQHGLPIEISANEFALGRRLDSRRRSEHNVNFWGEVCAADVFASEVRTRSEARAFVDLAISIGFTGIGVYSDTRNNKGEPQVMFHLGVRSNEKMGNPATWGRVNGSYDFTLEQAIDSLPEN